MAKGDSQKKSDETALAIRGIGANLGPHNADGLHADLHPCLKADSIFSKASVAGADQLRNAVNQLQSLLYAA